MDFISLNIDLIVIVVILLAIFIFVSYKFLTQPSDKRKYQIKQMLLIMVTEAEKLYGSKTGKLKFSYVYGELITKLPYLRYIPLSVIESLIEESLEEMKHLLESNPRIAEIVNKDNSK